MGVGVYNNMEYNSHNLRFGLQNDAWVWHRGTRAGERRSWCDGARRPTSAASRGFGRWPQRARRPRTGVRMYGWFRGGGEGVVLPRSHCERVWGGVCYLGRGARSGRRRAGGTGVVCMGGRAGSEDSRFASLRIEGPRALAKFHTACPLYEMGKVLHIALAHIADRIADAVPSFAHSVSPFEPPPRLLVAKSPASDGSRHTRGVQQQFHPLIRLSACCLVAHPDAHTCQLLIQQVT